MKGYKWFVMVLLAASGINAMGQKHQKKTDMLTKVDTVSTAVDSIMISQFADKLRDLERRLNSEMVSGIYDKGNDGRMYRLFAPLTFYHSVAKEQLDINDTVVDDVNSEIDLALLNIYFNRPDLVVNSDKRLSMTGTIRKDLDQPVKQKINLVENTPQIPEEPQVMPEGLVLTKPNFWTFSGDNYLQFLQNYVSGNWYKGGESNYSMVGSVVLQANYNNKRKLKFENKLELKLGFQTSRGDTLHKFKTNNDLIRYTGKLGIQARDKWYYTLQVLAYTQFTQGLKSNDRRVYSDFMSPFNLNLGLGMDYAVQTKNNKIKGNVNLSFLSFNFRYVDRDHLTSNYGIKGNHNTMEDFGSQLTVDLTWQVMEQVKWRTRLYGYTTYHRTELEWENTINLAVSKFISANIFLYPRFDDDRAKDRKLGYFQFKEYCSLGFSYSF